MNFLLRADASDKIGTGHVMRLFGLGEQLIQDGHTVVYCMAECPDKVLAKCPEGAEVKVNQAYRAIVPTPPGFVPIVDSHKLGAPRGGLKIKDHWFFLRNELRSIPRGRKHCRNVLVSYGGGFSAPDHYPQSLTNDSGLSFRISSFGDYAANLSWADVVVGGGGCSSLERAYLGIPSLLAQVADNQRPNIDWLCGNLAGIEVAFDDSEEQGKWVSLLKRHDDLVELMSHKAMFIVPGDSYEDFWKTVKRQVLS